MRSSSSAPPSTTAGRRPCSRPASSTRSRSGTQGLATAFVVTGGKLPGDRTTEAAVAREYAIAHGVPADGHLRRGPGAQHADLAVGRGRRAAGPRDMDSRRLRLGSRPTCCGCCGSPTTWGSTPTARRRRRRPSRRTPLRTAPGDRPRAGRAGGLLRLGRCAAGGAAGRLTPSRLGGPGRWLARLGARREPVWAADRERSRCWAGSARKSRPDA